MRHLSRFAFPFVVAFPLLAGCGGGPQFKADDPSLQAKKRADGSFDDHSMCDWRGKPDREASEVAGPGSIQPNVRRVYAIIGSGDDRHKVLICREIDTNFDGVKDVVRRYNDKGESIAEEADANFDGRIDTWITFIKGRLAEVQIDTNYDGRPDEWKFYSNGKLSRVKRDTNFDGRADVWEIYREGHLERMGVDIDGDEHVDRWDHDNEMRRRFEDAERKKEEAAVAAAQKKAQDEREANEKANEGAGDEPPAKSVDAPKRKPKKK
ncbi:putative lipoprotein [Minicystis rosea]|nr:putative lipoprotein [Minicystis rosea]